MEEAIAFQSDGLEIEGRLDRSGSNRAVVISHPHPLYGGTMDNPVVDTVQRAFRQGGYATLRFNFRGVGRSEGEYDDGRGERRDVLAALACLAEQGHSEIELAGYSFGAWVNASLGCGHPLVSGMVMVSPPAAFVDFSDTAVIECLKLVVTGGRDDIAPVRLIRNLVRNWNRGADLEIIPDADHFYSGCLETLESVLTDHLGRADSDV